jgi:predicted DNA-binding transcriptional regulator AlpA
MNLQNQSSPPDRLHRAKSAQRILGVSKSKFYEMVARGAIPAGLRLGANSVVWRESTLMEVIENLPVVSIDDPRRAICKAKVPQ